MTTPILHRNLLYDPHYWAALADACRPIQSITYPDPQQYLIATIANLARAISQLPPHDPTLRKLGIRGRYGLLNDPALIPNHRNPETRNYTPLMIAQQTIYLHADFLDLTGTAAIGRDVTRRAAILCRRAAAHLDTVTQNDED